MKPYSVLIALSLWAVLNAPKLTPFLLDTCEFSPSVASGTFLY